MAPQLQAYIDGIPNLPLHDAIQSIVDLFPGLIGSVSPKCKYIITHPDYEGEADLNTLGKHFLDSAYRCTRENASFKTRLLHQTLDNPFFDLYNNLYPIIQEGLRDGSMVREPSKEKGCACCCREPAATIGAGFHEGDAFLYEQQDYREIWGDQEGSGGRYWTDQEGREMQQIYASKEQIEGALKAAELQELVASRL